VSALTGRNIDKLVDAIRERELAGGEVVELAIPHSEPRVLAQLHEVGVIYSQSNTDDVTMVRAWIPKEMMATFSRHTTTQAPRYARGDTRHRAM
jgi:50S ribosomal subunit-associated GTPase HflX